MSVEPIWTTIFAKALAGRDISEILSYVGSVGSVAAALVGGAAAGGAAGGKAAEKAEEKKEEEEEESDEDMGLPTTRASTTGPSPTLQAR